ncbi:MAG: adenylate/guanylate cyclase domain-containing protein [Salibacteraceae bacterium]
MLAGLLYVNVEYGLLEDATHYPESMTLYNPINSLISILIMNCLLGLVLGILEELIFKNRFKQRSFTIKILAKTLLYIFIFLTTVMVFSFLLNAANSGGSITSKEVYLPTIEFFMSFGLVSIVVFAGFIIALSLFFSEIVDYLGLDIVGNFFSGKYSKPVIENRIFMFLDMKDSTTIAEKIGHQKQYRLLNDYYREMTAAIVQTEGAIYQYVGDEIIVSWSREQGLEQSNCLQCFFLIEKSIAARSQHFLDHYGVVPGFKAGLHLREVTSGQVGQIKRDL